MLGVFFFFFFGRCGWDCSLISGWGIVVFFIFFPPTLLLNPTIPSFKIKRNINVFCIFYLMYFFICCGADKHVDLANELSFMRVSK